MAREIEGKFEYFRPNRKNLINLGNYRTLFNLMRVSNDVINVMDKQTDLFFKKHNFSGSCKNEYISDKSLKPFEIEPQKKFTDTRCPFVENASPPFGYLPEVDRSWLFFDSTVYFWKPSKSSDPYICYPIDLVVEDIYLFPTSKEISNNSSFFIIMFKTKHKLKLCSASLHYDRQNNYFDFNVNLKNFKILTTSNVLTSFTYSHDLRAFFGSSDQIIYELNYSHNQNEIICELIDVTSAKISCLIPSLIYNMLEANPITQIEISQSIIYALDSKSNIYIYRTNSKIEKFTRIHTLQFRELSHQCNNLLKKQKFFDSSGVVSIYPTQLSDSRFIKFVVLFTNGFRAFISNILADDSNESNCSPTYRVVHLRQPPFDDVSEIKYIYSVYFTIEYFLICTNYGQGYRMWCCNRSLRCSSDLFQETLTIYSLNKPIVALASTKSYDLIYPIPYVISNFYTPKNRFMFQLEDFGKFPLLIGHLNENELIIIKNIKCHEILLSIYQDINYFNSPEFSAYTNLSTDIEFTSACLTVLGEIPTSDESIALSVTEDIWDSSSSTLINFSHNTIYKRMPSSDGSSNSDNCKFDMMYPDLEELNTINFDIVDSTTISLLTYTVILHVCSFLLPLWYSRMLVADENNCKLSLNLYEIKSYQNYTEKLMRSLKRVISFYRCKIQDSFFTQKFMVNLDNKMLDYEDDIQLLEQIENLTLLTYQWLCIWAGINAIDYITFIKETGLVESLNNFNFSDVIFNDVELSDEIIWKFIHYLNDKPKFLEYFIDRFTQDANIYFNTHFGEIAAANRKLVESLTSTYLDIRDKNLSSSLETYIKYPMNLDIGWICQILMKLNCHPNAISLCLIVSDNLSKSEKLSDNDDSLFHKSTKNNILTTIFNILNDSYLKNQNIANVTAWSEDCEHGSNFHSKNLRATILASLQPSQDQFIAFNIFDWIIDKDLSEYLVTCHSVHLPEYLGQVDYDELSFSELKKARCQYEIYQSDRNFELAALQLYKIAISNVPITLDCSDEQYLTLVERADYLQIAQAQLSLSSNNPETSTLINSIKYKLHIINLQNKIIQELENVLNAQESHPNQDFIVFSEKKLKSNIMPINTILDTIVIPCQLTTSYLLLIKNLGEKYADYDYIVKIWKFLFHQLIRVLSSQLDNTYQTDCLNQFKSLLTEYSHLKFCFPIEQLIFNVEILLSSTKLGHRWLPNFFADLSIIGYEEYAYHLQEHVFKMLANKEDFLNYDIILYMLDSYIYLCQDILKDKTKSAFANIIKTFCEYMESRIPYLNYDKIKLDALKSKAVIISNLVFDFYQKLIC